MPAGRQCQDYDMKRQKILLWALALLFAVLMSIPFLVPHCGFFALFGFVPLLCMERIASITGVKRVWVWHYSAFVLWNAFTTFWVCNATVGGGIFAVLANALQMSLIFGVFRLSKRHFKGVLPYMFLMVMWIAWERAYFDADISWPWLVLGNSFARSIGSIQWYEYTGTLGGSLWIWAANLTVFGLMVALSDGSLARWNVKARIAAAVWTVLVFAGPFVWSSVIWNSYEEKNSGEPLEVYVFQPNIDPYNKFQALTQQQQNSIILDQMDRVLPEEDFPDAAVSVEEDTGASGVAATGASGVAATEPSSVAAMRASGIAATGASGIAAAGPAESGKDAVRPELPATSDARKPGKADGGQDCHPILLLAPETFTNDVIVGDWSTGVTWRRFVSFLKDRPGVNMLFGASSYSVFKSPERPSYTARQMRDGRWMESHNSALMVDGSGRTEIFHKNKLVVAVEKTPYPAVFCKVDDWLGGVMGRCVGQDTVSVMHCVSPSDTVTLGCAICYESVYGEYYTDYVRKGAELMTIITNDAWWGNTPGYRQHLSYASLRAIETRRSIARCANTGISCFIDQRGGIHDPSPWWQKDVLHGYVSRNDEITFFVAHGDLTGRICSFVFALLALALLVNLLTIGKHREHTVCRK